MFAARQPILDVDKKLYAYEVLFRDSLENVFPEIDANEATSRLIAESQFNLGLEKIIGNKPAFINFTLDTLIKNYPTCIPAEQLVIEILETVQPGKRLLAQCKQFKEQGYTIALDDYIHQPVWRHFYPFVDIIKIDFRSSTLQDIEVIIEAIKDFPHIKLLAEKVETNAEFEQALALGFTLFQGYFFSRPEVIQAKSLAPSQLALAELLYETSKPDVNIPQLTQIIERDINLAYKLLRYANSATFRRRSEISTIKQAVVVLGHHELKKFLSVLFTAQVGTSKPVELTKLAMIRARFAENLAMAFAPNDDASTYFLTGLMSLIDAILDEEIEDVMQQLPLAQEIKDALIKHEGKLSNFLKVIKLYEKADWRSASDEIATLGFCEEKVPELYNEAIEWSRSQMQALGE